MAEAGVARDNNLEHSALARVSLPLFALQHEQ